MSLFTTDEFKNLMRHLTKEQLYRFQELMIAHARQTDPSHRGVRNDPMTAVAPDHIVRLYIEQAKREA